MFIKLSKILFFFLIFFTPLAFGTTELWSYAVMEVSTALALLLLIVHLLGHKGSFYSVPGLLPLLFFLLYIVFQIIPLPPNLIEWLSPSAFQIHHTVNQICDIDAWMTLSVNKKATLTELARYSTYVLFYVLTVQLLKEKSLLQTAALSIVLFGGLLAFSSILQFYLTEDMALWFRHSPNNSIVVGPYANHNHYAGLMEMIFPVVLGLFLFYRPRIRNTSLIKGIAEMMSQEKANIHILIGMAALLIIISIFVSLSRGAMLSTCLALIFFTYMMLNRRISKSNTLVILSVIILSALAIGWFGWDQIFERFASLKKAQGVIYESRLDFWKDTADIIKHNPVTGTGIGTFSHYYPLHRTIISDRFLTHAHNDYLELLAEAGIIGFILVSAFLISLFYKTFRVFKKRRDAFSIYLFMGCITGIISILFHSFVDFNLHIGANGLWFFFLAGLAVSAANTGIQRKSQKTRLTPITSSIQKGGVLLLASTLSVLVLLFNISVLLGNFYYTNIRNYSISSTTPASTLKKIGTIADYTIRFDPFHAESNFIKANAAWFLNDLESAKNHFISAVRIDPLNSRYLTRFGAFLARQGQPDKTDIAFEKAMQYSPTDPEYTFEYASWLIINKKTAEAIHHMKKVLELDDQFIDRVLTVMIINGIPFDQIQNAIPDTPGSSIAFADFLFESGQIEQAIDRYIATLDLIEKIEPTPGKDVKAARMKIRHYYLKIYYFFNSHKDFRNAMHVIERAEKRLPLDAKIKVASGDLFYRQGILFKAKEKYEQALYIDPKNQKALKMLSKINP